MKSGSLFWEVASKNNPRISLIKSQPNGSNVNVEKEEASMVFQQLMVNQRKQ